MSLKDECISAIIWVADDIKEKYKREMSKGTCELLVSCGIFFDNIKRKTSMYSFDVEIGEDEESIVMIAEITDITWDASDDISILESIDSFKAYAASEDSLIIEVVAPIHWEAGDIIE